MAAGAHPNRRMRTLLHTPDAEPQTDLTMQAAHSPQTRLHMHGIARVGAVIAVAALCFVVWNIISAHRAAAKLASDTEDAAIVTVNTTHPKPSDPTGSELVLPGTVQANIDAPIYARTSGYLKRWLV